MKLRVRFVNIVHWKIVVLLFHRSCVGPCRVGSADGRGAGSEVRTVCGRGLNLWRLLFATVLVVLLSGCGSKVGVRPVDLDKRFRNMYRTALTDDSPSERTLMFLRARALGEAWKKNPDEVLWRLDSRLKIDRAQSSLFALMELSFHRAQKSPDYSDRAAVLYLSCLYYAYAYLFDERAGPAPSAFDPHSRLACDFYNRSLAEILLYMRKGNIKGDKRLYLGMLGGTVEIAMGRSDFSWGIEEFRTSHSAYEFEPMGVDSHIRSYGIGLPVIAERIAEAPTDQEAGEDFLPEVRQVSAATLLIRFALDSPGEEAVIRGEYDLYDPLKTHKILIGDRKVPIETDFTVPLAYMVEQLKLPGGLSGLLDVGSWEKRKGLHLLSPYDPDKIPVVFVHGLMSSPETWLDMFNNLLADVEIREKYQFWFFMYPTGNPLLYSAHILRESLKEVRAFHDPRGESPTFNRMVLVGHSMGGLLSRLMMSEGGTPVWNELSRKPFEEIELDAKRKNLLEGVLFFGPQPFVSRSIFIATPHRGSEWAEGGLGSFGASLVKLPVTLFTRTLSRFTSEAMEETALFRWEEDRLPTGIDALKRDSVFVKVFGERPLSTDKPFHSIIGNREGDDTLGGTDGIVPYVSSHLPDAVSEKIVHSDHSAHRHPLAIMEVRRILLEHLDEGGN